MILKKEHWSQGCEFHFADEEMKHVTRYTVVYGTIVAALDSLL
jgi:hypothetical protein